MDRSLPIAMHEDNILYRCVWWGRWKYRVHGGPLEVAVICTGQVAGTDVQSKLHRGFRRWALNYCWREEVNCDKKNESEISWLHCHHQVSAGQLGFGLECSSCEGKNVELVLWPFKAYWLCNAPTGLTFNNCTFCPHCIYVFCIYLRTKSDLCHLQHKLIGFYNRDEKCLQRGTDWVFK